MAELKLQPHPHNKPQACILRRTMGPHHTCQRILIRHRKRRQSKMLGLRDKFLGMGATVQEGEVGGATEFGIGGHEGTSCPFAQVGYGARSPFLLHAFVEKVPEGRMRSLSHPDSPCTNHLGGWSFSSP